MIAVTLKYSIIIMKKPLPENIKINFVQADTLLYDFDNKYDLVIGNPPFTKLKY